MTTNRTGYAVALIGALIVLIGSIGLVAAYAGNAPNWPWSANTSDESWRQGLGNGMMGNGPGPGAPMMGRGWSDQDGDAQVSAEQAKKLADTWLAANQPGATAGTAVPMPMGYVFAITKDNQTVGTLMVNDDTGQVLFRQWSAATPTPTSGT